MKNLWNRVLPFATDSSGVCSLFCGTDTLVLGHDPGATVLRCYGFTENRTDKKARFEGIRVGEQSCTLGIYDDFIQQYREHIERFFPKRILLVGTPVSSMLGLDLNRMAEYIHEFCEAEVLIAETTGNNYYDQGMSEMMAQMYEDLCRKNCDGNSCSNYSDSGTIAVNLLGINSLDYPSGDFNENWKNGLKALGIDVLSEWGIFRESSDISMADKADLNIIFSSSALSLAKKMKKISSIPFVPAEEFVRENPQMLQRLLGNLTDEDSRKINTSQTPETNSQFENLMQQAQCLKHIKILIIGEQISSNLLRCLLEILTNGCNQTDRGDKNILNITVASFFMMNREYMRLGEGTNDIKLESEDDLTELLSWEKFDLVICDPLLKIFLEGSKTRSFSLVHLPVSGNYSYEYPKRNQFTAKWVQELLTYLKIGNGSNI